MISRSECPALVDTVEAARQVLRALESLHPGSTMTTMYLDVEGKRFIHPGEYLCQMDSLRRNAEEWGEAHPEDSAAVLDDFSWIERELAVPPDRSRTHGLLFVAASRRDIRITVSLPFPVRTEIAFAPAPAVGQLTGIVDDARTIRGVLLDSSAVRIYRMEFNRMSCEFTGAFVPEAPVDRDEWISHDRIQRQREEHLRQHVRRAAVLLERFTAQHPTDYLVLGGGTPMVALLERELPHALSGRVSAKISLPVSSSFDGVEAALAASRDALFREETLMRLDDALRAPMPVA